MSSKLLVALLALFLFFPGIGNVAQAGIDGDPDLSGTDGGYVPPSGDGGSTVTTAGTGDAPPPPSPTPEPEIPDCNDFCTSSLTGLCGDGCNSEPCTSGSRLLDQPACREDQCQHDAPIGNGSSITCCCEPGPGSMSASITSTPTPEDTAPPPGYEHLGDNEGGFDGSEADGAELGGGCGEDIDSCSNGNNNFITCAYRIVPTPARDTCVANDGRGGVIQSTGTLPIRYVDCGETEHEECLANKHCTVLKRRGPCRFVVNRRLYFGQTTNEHGYRCECR